jgi:hypothetical protein
MRLSLPYTAPYPDVPVFHVVQGDPSAPPAPAPRQGPRQLLSSLLGLADLCPEEWPPRGASKAAAKQRDADGDTAFGGKGVYVRRLLQQGLVLAQPWPSSGTC